MGNDQSESEFCKEEARKLLSSGLPGSAAEAQVWATLAVAATVEEQFARVDLGQKNSARIRTLGMMG